MKKIIISLFAINIAVLTLVFSMMPNDVNADQNPNRYNARWEKCNTGKDLYKNICFSGTKYVTCMNSDCAITIIELE